MVAESPPVSSNSAHIHWRPILGDNVCGATHLYGIVTVIMLIAIFVSWHPAGATLTEGRSGTLSCNPAQNPHCDLDLISEILLFYYKSFMTLKTKRKTSRNKFNQWFFFFKLRFCNEICFMSEVLREFLFSGLIVVILSGKGLFTCTFKISKITNHITIQSSNDIGCTVSEGFLKTTTVWTGYDNDF